ncbi:MAG: cellulase family glycosylhydrolase [Proteobacteria bacterium]|nr:cellulase family glycosylhydrolase [Pseudomonadota bacterium]
MRDGSHIHQHGPAFGQGAGGGPPLPWIQVAPGTPYFVDEHGAPFTPIGHNDAVCWFEIDGLYRRKDAAGVEAKLRWMVDHGVTVIRVMLEYAQERHRYIEKPVGRWAPNMVSYWDDLIELCERTGMRLLLTPFDTFWMWLHWKHHPYNRRNGGCLDRFDRVLLCPEAREAIKGRLTFAVERWGGSGVLFAWDLWNEIHPAQSGDEVENWPEFIHDLSSHVRALEQRLYGRTHPQTVSLFGPELLLKPHQAAAMTDAVLRHPDLDWASIHIYASRTIDWPRNTVDAACDMGRIVRECLAETPPERPFLDTEHGPIHSFKDKKLTLPEPFDDEYFRHMSWAHLAAGGAGGGMRWPNRRPHKLTDGMRRAQKAMAGFLPLIDWRSFRRRNLNLEARTSGPVHLNACGDADQAVVHLLRRDTLGPDGRLRADAAPITPSLLIPGLTDGRYRLQAWDTDAGRPAGVVEAESRAGRLACFTPPFTRDLAIAVRRAG